ncbi:MAG: penicillin-binding protein 2 [Acetobacteraceae bacterium]
MAARFPPLGGADHKTYARRLTVVALIALALGLALAGRLAWLQIVQNSHYTALARGNRIRVLPVAPTRGLIFDRNGRELAKNVPTYELTLMPDQVPHIKKTLKRLDQLVGLTPQDIKNFHQLEATKKPFQPVPVKSDLTPRELARFAVRRQDFPGVAVNATLKRFYPSETDSANVVGYVGLISKKELQTLNASEYSASAHVGKTGAEHEYEQVLHGKIGYQKVEVNAAGRELRVLETHPSTAGENIYLTIDTRLQQIAYNALGEQEGAVVAIQPATGAILCMASKPGYDPNLFVNGISHAAYEKLLHRPGDPLVNRAIAGRYAPGSTIKPFIGIAALKYGVLTPSSTLYAGPTFRIPGYDHVFHNWNPSQNGYETLATALIHSTDTFFYELAQPLGIHKMHTVLSEFGFGKTPPIDLPGARHGVNPSPAWKERTQHKPWYPGNSVNMSIGQGYLLVTPLQLASAVATIAMHGKRMRPHVLKAIVNPVTSQRKVVQPKLVDQVKLPDPAWWNYVVNALHQVIASPTGTAHRIAAGLKYPAAGKTGSAQVVSVYHPDSLQLRNIPFEQRVNGLFIAFAPLVHPEIAVAVVVQHGGVGAHSAAPIARAIISTWLAEHPPKQPSLQPLEQADASRPH